jgi:rRNA pseudouridine-1189 N-methylase Emg1 (Nep1/Mra1 family)
MEQGEVLTSIPPQVEVDYVERNVSFSEYPLSASVACGKICDAFEMKYGVL